MSSAEQARRTPRSGEWRDEVSYPGLPVDSSPATGRKPRICIASPEFVGPYRNGGIGTAYTSLGEALAAAGHHVTLLYTRGQQCENQTMGHWIAHYAAKGIRFVPLPSLASPRLSAPWFAATAYEVYLWLRAHDPFDVIHFPEMGGPGYYALLAKHQGLAFANSVLCVGTHSSTPWIREASKEYIKNVDDSEVEFSERESVALADVVWSPSQYLFRWMKARGWQLPKTCYVQPYIQPRSARSPAPAKVDEIHQINEFVFFGRLETRKGLILFCDALDLLETGKFPNLKLTFMGRHATVAGRSSADYIPERASRWAVPWQILCNLDQSSAVKYLQGEGRLAIMPSPVDNSPNTVYECLGLHIPFVAASTGGIPELVSPEDVNELCFPYQAQALAGRLREILRSGVRTGRPAVEAKTNESIWVAWHEMLVGRMDEQKSSTGEEKARALPLVSICLTHHNRPHYLRQALASLDAQDYPNFEVVLADNGSSQPDAIRYLDELEPGFARRGWQLIRQENRYLGAARNAAARHAQGEYLLFMNDDNYAKPHEISTFVRAALCSGADILTAAMDLFTGDEPPAHAQEPKERYIPLGGAAVPGILRNCFGDANALIRRDVFRTLGGFTEDCGIAHEDWEFFARAVLQGYRLAVVPEALFWHRVTEGSMISTTSEYDSRMRCLRPYMEALPASLCSLPFIAHGFGLRHDEMNGTICTLRQNLHAYQVLSVHSMVGMGKMLAELRHVDQAENLIADALNLALQTKDMAVVAHSLPLAIQVLTDLRKRERARSILLETTRAAQERKEDKAAPEVLRVAAEALAGLGPAQTAQDKLADALLHLAQRHKDAVLTQRSQALVDKIGRHDSATHVTAMGSKSDRRPEETKPEILVDVSRAEA